MRKPGIVKKINQPIFNSLIVLTRLKFTPLYIIFFFALNMVMLELHEQAHLTVGYLICGCYGERNVNTWTTCADCRQPALGYLVSFAGPLFSCLMIWVGTHFFIRSSNRLHRSLAFALVFANMPFARVLTAIVGGGDEKTGFIAMGLPIAISKILAIVLTLVACWLPVMLILRTMKEKRKWWIVTGFAILPMIYGYLYSHRFLNYLLKTTVDAQTNILGTPDMILYHTILMLIIVLITLHRLLQNDKEW